MPNVKLATQTCKVLEAALISYAAEVAEIRKAIVVEAKAAEYPPDDFIPPAIRDELQCVETALSVVDIFQRDDPAPRLFGFEVANEVLAVMGSALTIRREALELRLRMTEEDPLLPDEAAAPLRMRLAAIDQETARFWKDYGHSALLDLVQRRRAIKRGLAYPRHIDLEAVLDSGEGQEIEFMERYPSNAHELAKEVAAFATTGAGTIFLGVSDAGEINGLDDVTTLKRRDDLLKRIEGVCTNSVSPSLTARAAFEKYGRQRIVRIEVPKGPEPVYYSTQRPYVRHGSQSRPASPQEVTDLTRRWLDRQRGS